jgi:hypothetical protein
VLLSPPILNTFFSVPIPLEDLSSDEQPLSENLRFLSALDQEFKWAKKSQVESGPEKKVKEEKVDQIELKAICTMSVDQV